MLHRPPPTWHPPRASSASAGLAAAVCLALLSIPTRAGAAQLGDVVEAAIAVHLSNHGLATLGDAVQALVPPTLPIESLTGQYPCSDTDAQPLSYTLDPLDAVIEVDDVDLLASDGRLDLTLYATLSSTWAELRVSGDCSVLTGLNETCGVELPTTALEVRFGLALAVVDGQFEVVVDDVQVFMSPLGNPLSDCTLSSAIGTVLGQDPDFLTDTLLGLVEPTLEGIGPDLQDALSGIFDQLSIDTELSLGGANLLLALEPAFVQADDAGLALGLSATVDVDVASDCVDAAAGIELDGATWPELTDTAAGTSLEYDAGLLLSRDFVDMVLYGAWASGALCIEVSEFGGVSLDTDLLGGLVGDDVAALFPESRPAMARVVPDTPPRARFEEDGPPVHVDAVLGLDVIAELDYRSARLFRSDITADLGLDVDLTTEQLATALALPDGSLTATDAWSDLIGPGFSDGVNTLVDTVVGGLIPADLLPTLTLPSLLGMQIGGVVWLPSDDGAWQGAYVLLDADGVVPIEVAGCGAGDLGCDGGSGTEIDLGSALGCDGTDAAGCEASTGGGSCTTVAVPIDRLVPILLALLGAGMRRRRR